MYREEIKFNRGAFKAIKSVDDLKTQLEYGEFSKEDSTILVNPKTLEQLFVNICVHQTLGMDRDEVYTGDLDRIASEVALEIQALGIVANRRIRKRRFVIVGTLDELLD